MPFCSRKRGKKTRKKTPDGKKGKGGRKRREKTKPAGRFVIHGILVHGREESQDGIGERKGEEGGGPVLTLSGPLHVACPRGGGGRGPDIPRRGERKKKGEKKKKKRDRIVGAEICSASLVLGRRGR